VQFDSIEELGDEIELSVLFERVDELEGMFETRFLDGIERADFFLDPWSFGIVKDLHCHFAASANVVSSVNFGLGAFADEMFSLESVVL